MKVLLLLLFEMCILIVLNMLFQTAAHNRSEANALKTV